jgi:predicted DNA-binding ribbon-helix-helix protein
MSPIAYSGHSSRTRVCLSFGNEIQILAIDQITGGASQSGLYGVAGSLSCQSATAPRSKPMKSAAITRAMVVGGHKINFTLEEPIWAGLKEIAQCDHQTLSKLVAKIDSERHSGNLSLALRMFVQDYLRTHNDSRVSGRDGHDNGPSMADGGN